MTQPTNLHAGTDVYSSDGHKLGELHRVVLRRSDLSATHIVVDIGFLRSGRPLWQGGIGLDYDRLLPIEAVEEAGDERVLLALTAEQFRDAPEYTFESFEQPVDMSPGEFDIPDIVNRTTSLAAMIASSGNFWLHEGLNKAVDSVDITEGTSVWRQEPHDKLGEVHRVLLGQDGRVQGFVIRRGFLLKRDVVLPVRYVRELMDDVIRVQISDEHLDALQEYQS